MTYRVIEKDGWSYVVAVGDPANAGFECGPWRYKWEAEEYADKLNAEQPRCPDTKDMFK